MVHVRRRAIVSGRVQGVFFRASTCERARALGVTGWVRNRPDGTVELLAEGPPEAVSALLTWARTGPAAARVDHVAVSDVTGDDAERGDTAGAFEVR